MVQFGLFILLTPANDEHMNASIQTELCVPKRDCAIIIRRRGGVWAEKLELSSKNLDSTPPPKQNKIVLTPSVT